MSKPWFRMYSEFVSDPKVQLLAFEDQRHFIALLCLKCNETLDSAAPSQAFRDRMIAKALGLSPDAALEAKRRLLEVGLIDQEWQPVAWETRQYESDSSATRTRAYRERLKQEQNETSQERHSDVTVTDKSRAEQSRTEQRTAKADALARDTPGLDLKAWETFSAYRRSIGKPLKPASLPEAAKKLAAFGKDQAAVVTQSVANGWQGLFALKDVPRGTSFVAGRKSFIADEGDRDQLIKRAERIGFRQPFPGESMPAYETMLKREEIDTRERSKSSGPQRFGDIGNLAARQA